MLLYILLTNLQNNICIIYDYIIIYYMLLYILLTKLQKIFVLYMIILLYVICYCKYY